MAQQQSGAIAVSQEGWSFDPDRLFAELMDSGEDWSDKEAAASLLEELKKTVLAELKSESGEKSDAAREAEALADVRFKAHVTKMVAARRDANRAKVKYVGVQTMIELLRTRETTRRAEMNLTR